jgi:hypothetical protein
MPTESAFDFFLQTYEINYNNINIQGVPGGKINILGGHSIGHSKQNTLCEHVFYSEQFP